jgi:prevent-host-death family protein
LIDIWTFSYFRQNKDKVMLKTKERIITAQDLAEATAQALANAQQEPLVVTENGRPAAYLISIDMFDALLARLETVEQSELLAGIAQGEEQFKKGAFKTLDEARAIAEAAWQAAE